MIRMIMHGCNGRMGQMITKLAADDPEITIVAGVDISDTIKNGCLHDRVIRSADYASE